MARDFQSLSIGLEYALLEGLLKVMFFWPRPSTFVMALLLVWLWCSP